MYFRNGSVVYAFIPMSKIGTAEDQVLEENLTKVRNLFYQIDEGSQSTYSNIMGRSESEVSPTSSMFGPHRSYHQGDSFNDS